MKLYICCTAIYDNVYYKFVIMSSISEQLMNNSVKVFFMADVTGSMGTTVATVKEVLRTLLAVGALATGESPRLATYTDFDGAVDRALKVLPATASPATVTSFLNEMRHGGGGGTPEAHKFALKKWLADYASEADKWIIFNYTDAPPHGVGVDARGNTITSPLDSEGVRELAEFKLHGWDHDWKSICNAVQAAGGTVVTILTSPTPDLVTIWEQLGPVVQAPENTILSLTNISMAVLYGMLGLPHPHAIRFTSLTANGRQMTDTIPPVHPLDVDILLRSLAPEPTLEVFRRLLTPSQPRNALALLTHFFGKIWRGLICGRFRYMLDGKYATECQQVMDLLSQCTLLLTGPDRTAIQEWNVASRDETPWIREQTAQAMPTATVVLVLPDELKGSLSLDDILAVGHGGGNIQALCDLISALQVVPLSDNHKLADDDTSPSFLPLGSDMKARTLFALVANLLSPRLRFQNLMSLMVAVLSLRNIYLATAADQFLQENVGRWISWELKDDGTQKFPVCWSMTFIRILRLCPNRYLTPEEVAFRDHYLRVSSLIQNQNVELTLTVPRHGAALWNGVTWKRLCEGCAHPRCFTVFPGNSQFCGICIALGDDRLVAESRSRGFCTEPRLMSEDSNSTSFAQCSRPECRGVYSVRNTADLRVRPICHDCRARELTGDGVTCNRCCNHYLSPGGSARRAMEEAMTRYRDNNEPDKASMLSVALSTGTFVCPGCVGCPQDMVLQVPVTIRRLIEENPWLKTLVPIDNYQGMMDQKVKFWERVRTLKTHVLSNDGEMKIEELEYNGLIVHNPREVVRAMLDALMNNSGMECCPLCADDVSVANLVPACGNCPNRICRKCSHHCYSGVVVGEVVAHGQTVCPFCKTPPKHRLVRNKGMVLGHLRNVRPNRQLPMCRWDPRTIYASCLKCLCVMPALDRVCAQAAPEIHGFTCDGCRETEREMKAVSLLDAADTAPDGKQCPGCGASTHHGGGCNHMTCTNRLKDAEGKVQEECATHWCWHCGVGGDDIGPFDDTNIYDHMARCGGIFPINPVHDDADDHVPADDVMTDDE